MVHRLNSVFILFTLWSMQCEVRQCGGQDAPESDEDIILNDALLLIKLLKTRDRSNISANLFHELRSIPAPELPQSPLSVSPLENSFQPLSEARDQGTLNDLYRRNMPQDHNGYFRRKDYDDLSAAQTYTSTTNASGVQQARNRTETLDIHLTTSSETTSQSVTEVVTMTRRVPSTTTSPTSTLKYVKKKAASRLRSRKNRRKSKVKIKRVKPKLRKLSRKSDQTAEPSSNYNETRAKDEDLISSQIKSELENELNTLSVKDKKGGNQKRPAASSLSTGKPTLKIYLNLSSRLPFPLPPNHAFCFTNPNNGLCRTFI